MHHGAASKMLCQKCANAQITHCLTVLPFWLRGLDEPFFAVLGARPANEEGTVLSEATSSSFGCQPAALVSRPLTASAGTQEHVPFG